MSEEIVRGLIMLVLLVVGLVLIPAFLGIALEKLVEIEADSRRRIIRIVVATILLLVLFCLPSG